MDAWLESMMNNTANEWRHEELDDARSPPTSVATDPRAKTIGIYAAILVSHGVVNSFGVRLLKYLNNVSIFLHSAGVASLCIAVLAKAPTHQPASFVFGTFSDGTGLDGAGGWSTRASPAYVALCGALVAQYILTGFA